MCEASESSTKGKKNVTIDKKEHLLGTYCLWHNHKACTLTPQHNGLSTEDSVFPQTKDGTNILAYDVYPSFSF